jgi:hypothetical protein
MTITITTTTPPKKRTSRQPRKLKICVWTHLGLIKRKMTSKKKWKTTSKKMRKKTTSNKKVRQPWKRKIEDNLKK